MFFTLILIQTGATHESANIYLTYPHPLSTSHQFYITQARAVTCHPRPYWACLSSSEPPVTLLLGSCNPPAGRLLGGRRPGLRLHTRKKL